MTQALAEILKQASQLSPEDRAEPADRIMESMANDTPTDVSQKQIAEIRIRIGQVESGEVQLAPGEEALARVRQHSAGSSRLNS